MKASRLKELEFTTSQVCYLLGTTKQVLQKRIWNDPAGRGERFYKGCRYTWADIQALDRYFRKYPKKSGVKDMPHPRIGR